MSKAQDRRGRSGVESSLEEAVAPTRLGDYQILSVLGEGGMGVVYLAEHGVNGRRVALKRLKDRYAAEPALLRRFFEESQAVLRLRNPHIAAVSDFVTGPQGAFCIMEYLEGCTLADELRRRGRLGSARALDVAHQVADALVAAHGAGIVHRDVKPSNIYLHREEGRAETVKLFDFGVAQLTNGQESGTAVRRLAGLLSPPYMSPEQAAAKRVDARTDIYSLGVVLYEMLRGTPPFRARSFAEYVYKHANLIPRAPGTLFMRVSARHRRAARLAGRCLEKDPARRFATAEELREALRDAGARH